ncbi:hypothetical protein [Hymenobacter sp. BRD67]|uniref:hypothetical protein n=1 Tax=Hymenobacter sp. BRD67 TaxID=2675877 RepID=UPI001565C5A1|nr:hypothetical protein [Hymenobacter sp. BRD67]QKG54169.1 hypothetical protein GKZ67_18170 [Hymenobacter sp. BRD67]
MLRYLPLGLLWLATAASAQIEPVSPARQRAAERQARRAAHTVEAPYKDSHLDAPHRPLRRGESAPLPAWPTSRGLAAMVRRTLPSQSSPACAAAPKANPSPSSGVKRS